MAARRLMGIDATKSENQQSGGAKIAHNILFVEYHTAFRQSASYLMDQAPDLGGLSPAPDETGELEGQVVIWLAHTFVLCRFLPGWSTDQGPHSYVCSNRIVAALRRWSYSERCYG